MPSVSVTVSALRVIAPIPSLGVVYEAGCVQQSDGGSRVMAADGDASPPSAINNVYQ
jgi:hypothetical protein